MPQSGPAVLTSKIIKRDYEDFLRIMEDLQCGFVAVDSEANVVHANHRLREWLGYSKEEIVGSSVVDFAPRELRGAQRDDVALVMGGDLRPRLVVLECKRGDHLSTLVLPQELRDGRGELAGYFAMVIDLHSLQSAPRVVADSNSALRSRLHGLAMELHLTSLMPELATLTHDPLQSSELDKLSPRQREILRLLIAGERVPDIAEELHLSAHTVRNHLKSTYHKLGVHSQAELVRLVKTL